jgi:hypothetical protein
MWDSSAIPLNKTSLSSKVKVVSVSVFGGDMTCSLTILVT